jgi:hypothetical protein
MKSVKIVIPIYKTDLDEFEQMSLKRSVEILGKHFFSVVCPEGLDLSPIENYFKEVKFEIKRFSPHFFKGIDGYNLFMLSPEFYQAYLDVDYILICQTDVYVFKDDLLKWCDKNYDYIGAPWIASPQNAWNKLMLKIRNAFNKKKKSDHYFFKVGNGGFSLRKVEMMHKIVVELKSDIEKKLQTRDQMKFYQEDVFLSLYAPKFFPEMKIPDYKEAVDFCIDRKPHIAYKINGNKLPFACHGFNKPKVRAFWQGKF